MKIHKWKDIKNKMDPTRRVRLDEEIKRDFRQEILDEQRLSDLDQELEALDEKDQSRSQKQTQNENIETSDKTFPEEDDICF